ncbi:MAG: hypothetical protein U5L76_03185 [Patescibacteria group bacterium]|nr:hypothetical protein [Patescibacteria group bacterium]
MFIALLSIFIYLLLDSHSQKTLKIRVFWLWLSQIVTSPDGNNGNNPEEGGLTMSRDMLGIAVRKLVTLPNETLGSVCDLLEKLSDPQWVRALKKFLRKENPWEAPRFSVFKTIKLGNKDTESLQRAIKNAGMKISDWSRDIMSKPTFTLANSETTVELFTATVAELGFSGHTCFNNICTRIRELGYELCPAEVGPQLRLQYPDQPSNECLYIAMESITDSDGDLELFYVGHGAYGRWLSTNCGLPDFVWSPDHRFVFVRSK